VDKELLRKCASQMEQVIMKFRKFHDTLLTDVVNHKKSASGNDKEIQKMLRDTYTDASSIRDAFLKKLDKAIGEARAARH
jgi:hypothetical protein